MTASPQPRVGLTPGWVALIVAIIALVVATAALTASFLGPGWGPSMMGGTGALGGPGMMGGRGMMGSRLGPVDAGPGQPGFVAGTVDDPRVVRLWAGPGYAFNRSAIAVARGETITFVVTTMGPLVHEFMVGPADAVAADAPGTPEVADLGMMQTGSLTFTFDGAGPYAYACHAPGHYEAGMRGTITVGG